MQVNAKPRARTLGPCKNALLRRSMRWQQRPCDFCASGYLAGLSFVLLRIVFGSFSYLISQIKGAKGEIEKITEKLLVVFRGLARTYAATPLDGVYVF